MDKMIFQVNAIITGDRSLSNGSRQFTLITQENMQASQIKQLLDSENKYGWFTFATEMIEPEDLAKLPKVDYTKSPRKKSPSKRLRAVMAVLYEIENQTMDDFDKYYEQKMESIIDRVKSKIEDAKEDKHE